MNKHDQKTDKQSRKTDEGMTLLLIVDMNHEQMN